MVKTTHYQRSDCEHINNKAHPYDWTFTTEYTGTLKGNFKVVNERAAPILTYCHGYFLLINFKPMKFK